MASTLSQIVTAANLKIGGDPISSLAEEEQQARVYAGLWKPVLDRCLDAAPWKFATRTLELTRLVGPPADPRWKHRFTLPADYRRTRFMMNAAGARLLADTYISEGHEVFSNYSRLILKYGRTYSEADIGSLPSSFVQYFICSLAYESSEPLSSESNVKQSCARDTQLAFNDATVIDGWAESGSSQPQSTWRRVRGG